MSDNDYEAILRQALKDAADRIAALEAENKRLSLLLKSEQLFSRSHGHDPCRERITLLEAELAEAEADLAFMGAKRGEGGLSVNMQKYHAAHRCETHSQVKYTEQDLDTCMVCLQQALAERTRERDEAVKTGKYSSLENNRLAQQERAEHAERERAEDRAAIRALRDALAPAAIWQINGVARVRCAIDGDGLTHGELHRILSNLLNACADHAPAIARASQGE